MSDSPYGTYGNMPLMKGSPHYYYQKFIHLDPQRDGLTTTYVNIGELWGRLEESRIVLRNWPNVTASHRLQLKETGVIYQLERVDRGDDELICKRLF